MVFESLVVDLVNKYLGAYVENLDPSQLSIGIWGGDVVLENLHVKGDALKDLDLPVQIKAGFIGKLTLKIPWKNLYKAPVEATLNGLYILAMPNESVKYDQKKEDESAEASKQAELQAIEEQLLKKSEGKKEEKKDGFVEKLSTQIIKNLQIDIQNIHIRYEDESTIKNEPFAFGITLSRLSLQTTNQDWIPSILDESVKMIFKMVNLSALSVYWNSKPSKMVWKCSREEQLEHFRATITEDHYTPKNMTYIIKPISLKAKLRLNPKPMTDLENPKIILGVILNQIGLCLSHKQYHSVMQLVESMDRMSVNQPFRKFKPLVGVHNNSKAWWKYAYNSMVQAEVKRKVELFSWKHIKAHRDKLKRYKKMYKEKLVQKNPTKEIVEKLIKMENDIDVFNITLMRQMAETELVKQGEVIKSKKSRHQKEEKSGWFGGWFGGGSKSEKPKEPSTLAEAFDEKEKKLLYEAIDYTAGESAIDEIFPIEYVATNVDLNLQKVSVELLDNRENNNQTLINLQANDIATNFKQRPSANAIGLTTSLKEFKINGLKQGDLIPHLVSSNINADSVQGDGKLLNIFFETNPIDGSCDQKIRLGSQPLQITYDADTINTLLDFVKPPKNLSFQQLKTVAATAYEDVKEQTATGLKHAMKSRKVLGIDINLMSSYVVVPYAGVYKPGCPALVVDLGEVNIKSTKDDIGIKSSTDIAQIRSQAYDKFKIDVKNIQILLANQNDDWSMGRRLSSSPMHILEPLTIAILLEKCIIANDAALPKLKVSGDLPLVSLRITDAKIHNAVKLAGSIPLPPSDDEPVTETFDYIPLDTSQSLRRNDLKFVKSNIEDQYGSSGSVASLINTSSADEEFFTADSDFSDTEDHLFKAMQKKKLKNEKDEGIVQLTDVSATFVIDKILVVIGENVDNKDKDVLSLCIENFGVIATVRTWDTNVNVFLGGISLQYLPIMCFDGSPLYVVRTPSDMEKKLLSINLTMAKKNCPDFAEFYKNTEQRIEVRFCALEVNIHYIALRQMRALSLKLIPKTDTKESEFAQKPSAIEMAPTESESFATAKGSNSSQSTDSKKVVPVAIKKDIVNVHLVAVLESFIVNLHDTNKQLASIAIQGIESNIKVKPASTAIQLKLKDIIVIDFHPDTMYQEIMRAVEGDVLTADMTVFNDNTLGDDYKDMDLVDTKVKVRLGAMRIVFLKRFIDGIVAYSSQFQDAKAMAEQAGAMAQEAAISRAKKIAERNPRILLDVIVTVPSIVIPKNSNSLEAMAADLGNIKIHNSFEIVGAQDTEIPAVSDNMVIDILDVKLSLCTLDDSKAIISEHQILEPVCLNVTLKRNLAATWFHDVPDMSIGGKMEAINVKFSSYDVSGMLQILDQNMNECPPPEYAQTQSLSKPVDPVKDPELGKISSAVSATSTLKDESLAAKSIWDTLKLNFVMESVRVNMYTDNQREFPLAKFFVVQFVLMVDQRSDTSHDISVSLADILLEDLRVTHKDRLTKYIERKSNSLSNHVLNAQVNKLSDGAMNIKAQLSSLSIILCVEFLVKVANLFAQAFAKTADAEKDEVAKTKLEVATVTAKEAETSREASSEVNSAVHIEFILHRPDIILVTDLQSDTAESIVLGMKLEVIFNTSTESSTKRLACKLSELQINSCPFNEISNLSMADLIEHKKVLAPCNFDINGIMSDEKQEFFIEISKIRIIASPIVINTITEATAMLATVSSSETAITNIVSAEKAPSVELNFNLKEKKYWFIEQADEILKADKAQGAKLWKKVKRLSMEVKKKMSENLRLSVPDIRIQLEAGEGHHSVPLLITQLGVNAEVKNWSGGEMHASASLSLGVVYFNEGLSVWEPLVEPIETNPGFSSSKYKLWELNAEVKQNKPIPDEVNVENLPSLMEVSVTSPNLLHTTITHATLKALNGLGKAFADAAIAKSLKKESPSKRVNVEEVSAGIKIRNVLGRELNITVGKGLNVLSGAQKLSDLEYVLKHGSTLYADFAREEFADIWALIENQSRSDNSLNNLIHIRLPGQQDYGIFDVSKTGLKYHSLSDGKKSISIISNVASKRGVRKVTLQSCLGIYNHLLDKLQVINESNTIIGVIEPRKHFPIPNSFVEDGSKLFLQPTGEQIHVSKAQVQVDKKSFNEVVRFPAASTNSLPVYINIETTSQDISQESGGVAGTLTKIACKPSVVLKNFLPFDVDYTSVGVGLQKNQRVLAPGTNVQVYDAEMDRSKIQVTLKDYRGGDWMGSVSVTTGLKELSDWQFENTKVKGKFMTLGKHVTYSDGFMVITLYSPYWMVNETSQTLEYKGGDDNLVVHPPEKTDFILFAYNSKSFLQKNSLQLRVNKSNYSDAFSIDAVGSNGTMICKDKEFNYMVGTSISLTSFGFTKIVTFSSYFTFSNFSSFDLEICEASTNTFTGVSSNSKIKFWPETQDTCIKIRIKNQETSISEEFGFRKLDSGVLLKLGETDEYVFADVTVTEFSVTVSFKNYYIGSSAVMIVNHTAAHKISVSQSKVGSGKVAIKPSQAMHFIWPAPSRKRLMSWQINDEKENTIDVFQEDAGTVKLKGKSTVKWVLFIDGMQRVLIVTENDTVAEVVQQGLSTERSNMDVTISLQGISLSIVDTKLQREIMYFAIISSGIIWEERPKKRWKALPLKYATALEQGYQKHNADGKQSSASTQIIKHDNHEFDLAAMKEVKPNKAEIRRFFSPGIWCQYTVSNHQTLLHVKVNKIQIDNQLQAAVFPVVLHPIPLPKTVAVDSSPKPFVELSIMTRKSEHQSFTHIKYYKVLVQEFSIKLDMGFISALLPVFGADQIKITPEKEMTYFQKDVAIVDKRDDTNNVGQPSAITFYDNLHLSPIKVHISFSMQNNCFDDQQTTSIVELPFNAFTAVLQSVGVTLSDIDDVVFKLGYFERFYQFFSQQQFTTSVSMHYAGQAIKQMYVLVLGLDVIGNPYGLVMGIAEGVTDMFYEPYQGMIQGPGEFVEGLALGARSLLGHTVGGAAGAVSRVTGALGKGIATMTMDDDYKKKRQMEKNKQPADLKEGLARGGKGLVMGVVGGLTGVITKPVEGAQKEGAAGFFKGVGKGLIGVVARPASGVIDLASNTFEGIQSLADMSEEVKRMRPARSFNRKDGILHPYSLKKAQGNAMLMEVEKGAFTVDQYYIDHAALNKSKKSFIILTDKMILEAHTGEIFGEWTSAWDFEYAAIIEEPHMVEDGIKIVTEKHKHKLFSKSSNGMTISFHDSPLAKEILEQMRKCWNEAPKFDRTNSVKKKGLGFSFKKHSKK